jgi:hypothetical protein
MNGPDLDHPLDWRIKPYTQLATAAIQDTTTLIRRLKRDQNQMADLVAKQALRAGLMHQPCNVDCSHEPHMNECPLSLALNVVTINSAMVLSASCC